MSIDVRQIRCLVGLADHGTLVRAAEILRMSQPAMSRAIHDLEGVVGVRLVRPKGRRLELTPAGEVAVEAGRQVLTALDDVPTALAAHAARPRLRVAVTSSMGPMLARAFAAFQRQAPMIGLRSLSASTDEAIANMLISGEADVAFGALSKSSVGLTHVALAPVEVVLISPLGTDLPANVSPAMLDKVPLLCVPAGSKSRSIMEDAFIGTGVAPRIVFEAEDTSMFVPAVQAGIGSTLVWRPNCKGLRGIEIRSFEPRWRVEIGCLFPKRASSMTLQFVTLLRDLHSKREDGGRKVRLPECQAG